MRTRKFWWVLVSSGDDGGKREKGKGNLKESVSVHARLVEMEKEDPDSGNCQSGSEMN